MTIQLVGTDNNGAAVDLTTTTDANGDYTFADIQPGTYTLTETQPANFGNGQSNVGTGATATAGENTFTTLVIGNGANAVDFDFGEVLSALSKRRLLASSTTP